jgi:hypothetical protein
MYAQLFQLFAAEDHIAHVATELADSEQAAALGQQRWSDRGTILAAFVADVRRVCVDGWANQVWQKQHGGTAAAGALWALAVKELRVIAAHATATDLSSLMTLFAESLVALELDGSEAMPREKISLSSTPSSALPPSTPFALSLAALLSTDFLEIRPAVQGALMAALHLVWLTLKVMPEAAKALKTLSLPEPPTEISSVALTQAVRARERAETTAMTTVADTSSDHPLASVSLPHIHT